MKADTPNSNYFWDTTFGSGETELQHRKSKSVQGDRFHVKIPNLPFWPFGRFLTFWTLWSPILHFGESFHRCRASWPAHWHKMTTVTCRAKFGETCGSWPVQFLFSAIQVIPVVSPTKFLSPRSIVWKLTWHRTGDDNHIHPISPSTSSESRPALWSRNKSNCPSHYWNDESILSPEVVANLCCCKHCSLSFPPNFFCRRVVITPTFFNRLCCD